MKKLVSLLSAVAMLAMLAVPASAALNYEVDDDGWYVITEMPTDAEVAAYTPNVAATAQKFETDEDLTNFGGSSFKKKYSKYLAENDVYVVTYDVTGIGTLVSGSNEDYGDAFFGIAAMNITYDGSTLPAGFTRVQYSLVAPDGTTAKLCTGEGLDGTNLNTIYSTGVTAAEIMPPKTGDEGQAVVDGSFKVQYVLYFPKQTAPITLKYVGTKFDYKAVSAGGDNRSPINTAATGNDLVLGAAPAPTPVEPSYELVKEYDLASGYGWDVVIKNFDSEKTYTAKFTNLDDAEDTRPTATINGLAEIAETDGDVAFAALIRLTNGRSNIKFEIEIQ